MHVERVTLLDQARQMYHANLTEGTSQDVTSHCAEASVRERVVNTSQIVGVKANEKIWTTQRITKGVS